MRVVKRSGQLEEVSFDKVLRRIQNLSYELTIDPSVLAQQVCGRIYDKITTYQLDEFSASLSASMSTENIDYETLASRLIISNVHKTTHSDYGYVVTYMEKYLSEDFVKFVRENIQVIQSFFDFERDYLFDYFGFKTLEKGNYLFRDGKSGKTIERPQHMIMRVSIGIHLNDILEKKENYQNIMKSIKETYDMISQKYYTHATPTLFNSGTHRPQLSSCFLIDMSEDSIDGIYDTLKDCALISKEAGGIGLSIHKIRGKNSEIRGTNGISNGLIPMLKVYNETAKYVDQGGGKRKGSFAIYLEPWHKDIYDFLDLKRSRGSEEMRARDLFYALWIPNLFMKRVKESGVWTLMCPNECPGLNEVYGEDFERLYTYYENKYPELKRVPAQDLWRNILNTEIETGGPYLLFKDHCNEKSNHKNLGTIQSSNLCTEIIQYTNSEETAVCNLASICLPSFVKNKRFDFLKLREIVHKIVENLNRVIDVNYYPTPKCKRSNKKHRPIGMGVQGLADTFQELDLSWEDESARKLNRDIFEVIYYSGLEKSCELAKKYGKYDSYDGSPISNGVYQFDMWNVKPSGVDGLCNWDLLRENIRTYGVRNSLLVAPMPTASTSQIMGFSECFEPYTSNIFIRRTNAGEFKMINRRMIRWLMRLNLWNEDIKNRILLYDGSIQWMSDNDNPEISRMKKIFKTVWEIKHKLMVDYSCERGAFIDQSQSFNVYMEEPTINKLNVAYFYSWEKGLKTCQYYLRIRTKANAIKFTIDPNMKKTSPDNADGEVCRRDNPDCLACSS